MSNAPQSSKGGTDLVTIKVEQSGRLKRGEKSQREMINSYPNVSKLSGPGAISIGTFDLGIQYFTMTCNVRKNL